MLPGLISIIVNLLIFIIFMYAVLSYISPHSSIRNDLERFLSPMLNPIRQILPPTGMFDFSPMVLLFLIYIVKRFLIGLLR